MGDDEGEAKRNISIITTLRTHLELKQIILIFDAKYVLKHVYIK